MKARSLSCMVRFLLISNQRVDQRLGGLPFGFETLEGLPALVGDRVVPPARPGALVPPVGGDISVFLQPPECGVEGGFLQLILAAGLPLDGFVNFIAVTVPEPQLREDDRVGVCLLYTSPSPRDTR